MVFRKPSVPSSIVSFLRSHVKVETTHTQIHKAIDNIPMQNNLLMLMLLMLMLMMIAYDSYNLAIIIMCLFHHKTAFQNK